MSMDTFILDRVRKPLQYMLVIVLIGVVSMICHFLSGFIGYKVLALILLAAVSFTAMFFDIKPVLLAAFLSALVWDFFFIPPHYTLHIDSTEDAIMLLMYFIVAMVNAVLTFKIRQIEKLARLDDEKAKALKFYNILLNSLSHELRTPIATIIGASDNLTDDRGKLSNSDQKALLIQISSAAMRLNQQIENLLNMSRLESGIIKPKPDWCDIYETINFTINQLEEELKNHKIKLIVSDGLPLFKLDNILIIQTLKNLLCNAALYTPDNSTIRIDISFSHYSKTQLQEIFKYYPSKPESIDKLIITISDEGSGFPADEIEKVFEKFYRLKKSRTGGTGLGLPIAKGFIEAHHGTITLNNLPEKGSVFTIEIPAESSYLNNLKNE
jgi:two-component system, OmpR family, sensor histidine kinase KdpD